MKNKVYIGWDPRETLAYDVAEYSLKKYSNNLDIKALKLSEINNILNRPIEWRGNQMWCPISEAPQTTEFSISRFAIPFMEKGWVLFADCDIIALENIDELFDQADPQYAVMVVKHQQKVGSSEIKMVDQASVYYNRKNWSSVMLINCNHPAHEELTLHNLNKWPGRDLHAFKWLKDEEIGELDNKWNHLVDINDNLLLNKATILHYTLGGPWISGWEPKESDAKWNEMYKEFDNQ
jgi:lipopolysaccharide biosynthesis glycosyltransferase